MTHMEWGLVMVAAALVLGGLLGGPFWWSAGHRRGRRDEAWEAELDRAVHRHPAGNGRHAGPDLDTLELPARTELPYLASPVVFAGYAAEPELVPAAERELLRVAHEDQAMAIANEIEPRDPVDQAMTVACSYCFAEQGEQCIPHAGLMVHRARVDAWKASLAPEVPDNSGQTTRTTGQPDPMTDSQFTDWMAADMSRFLAGLIGGTDETLKEITR